MADETNISWCDATFNPWRGCVKIAEGCKNCYAASMSKRNPGTLGLWGPEGVGNRVVAVEPYWKQPVQWNEQQFQCPVCNAWFKAGSSRRNHATDCAGELPIERRRRVFCASLADVFEDWQGPMRDVKGRRLLINDGVGADGNIYPDGVTVDDDWGCRELTMDDVRRRLFELIDATPNLDWLILTKRPENIRRMWPLDRTADSPDCQRDYEHRYRHNVWLLTSVSEQATADRNIPELLKCRDLVPVLGVSAEPLCGPIDLVDAHRTTFKLPTWPDPCRVDWLIVGGESGPNYRPCEVEWIQSLADQGQAAGVPVFVKQDAHIKSGQQGRIPDELWGIKQFPEGGAE
jgi:protein gp37